MTQFTHTLKLVEQRTTANPQRLRRLRAIKIVFAQGLGNGLPLNLLQTPWVRGLHGWRFAACCTNLGRQMFRQNQFAS